MQTCEHRNQGEGIATLIHKIDTFEKSSLEKKNFVMAAHHSPHVIVDAIYMWGPLGGQAEVFGRMFVHYRCPIERASSKDVAVFRIAYPQFGLE